jgi:hypothetical protein
MQAGDKVCVRTKRGFRAGIIAKDYGGVRMGLYTDNRGKEQAFLFDRTKVFKIKKLKNEPTN